MAGCPLQHARSMRSVPFLSCVVAGATLACGVSAQGAVLHQFTTTDATVGANDDGYDPLMVTVAKIEGVIAPGNGAELGAGAVQLVRFFNTEFNGFSFSSDNGNAIDPASDFDRGYFTWTVEAEPGLKLNQ